MDTTPPPLADLSTASVREALAEAQNAGTALARSIQAVVQALTGNPEDAITAFNSFVD